MPESVPLYRHRSYTQLDQVRRCGWQYKLARVDRVPKRPSWAQVAGVLLHGATETVDRAIEEARQGTYEFSTDEACRIGSDRLADLWPATEEEFSKHYSPDEWKVFGKQDAHWWWNVGMPQAIDAYVGWRQDRPSWHLATVPDFGTAIEVPFQLTLPTLVEVHGWIDRIFTIDGHDGEYYPVDIKSGRKPETDEQLGVYGCALDAGLHWEAPYGFFVYDLKSGRAKTTNPISLAHHTLEDLGVIYANADRIIRDELFVPHPGDQCFTCDVVDHCPFARSAI